ncbi:MAG: MarR family winged helix-turn-helix transcriptional regulator [Candidatus Saccharimonadales bacterium]
MASKKTALEATYIKFIEFLMLSKHQVFDQASKYGLTGMQAITVCFLDQPKPMNSFGKLFSCDPSNVTGIISGLESKGLIRRFENPNDHRIKMVQLNSKGQNVRSKLLGKLCGLDSALLSKLSAPEMGQFSKLINKITSD